LSVPGDLAVDNRALLAALLAAVATTGVRVLRRRVERVLEDGCGVTGVALDDGTTLGASAVLVAAGAWSAALHPALARLVRPVKGEILRLRARHGALPPPGRRSVTARLPFARHAASPGRRAGSTCATLYA